MVRVEVPRIGKRKDELYCPRCGLKRKACRCA
jgi:hypothetical protein